MQDKVLVFVSGIDDVIGPRFQQYCGNRGLEVLLATNQSRTQFYYELPAGLALLRVDVPRDCGNTLQASDLRGIWFRRMPDTPAEIDEEDAVYASTEFAAGFIGFLRSTAIPCFGFSPRTPFRPHLNIERLSACSIRLGIPLLSEPDSGPLLPISIRDYLCAPVSDGPEQSTTLAAPKRDALPEGIYYVLFANKRQILAPDGCHSDDVLARALQIGDRIVSDLRLGSAVVEMGLDQDGTIALGIVGPYVPDSLILRNPPWYFDAVLDALNA